MWRRNVNPKEKVKEILLLCSVWKMFYESDLVFEADSLDGARPHWLPRWCRSERWFNNRRCVLSCLLPCLVIHLHCVRTDCVVRSHDETKGHIQGVSRRVLVSEIISGMRCTLLTSSTQDEPCVTGCSSSTDTGWGSLLSLILSAWY